MASAAPPFTPPRVAVSGYGGLAARIAIEGGPVYLLSLDDREAYGLSMAEEAWLEERIGALYDPLEATLVLQGLEELHAHLRSAVSGLTTTGPDPSTLAKLAQTLAAASGPLWGGERPW